MREEILFTVDSPYRQPIQIKGYHFGSEDKTLAVMGALRGNEIQQMYICARLVETFTSLEKAGRLSPEFGLLIVPCANQFSMNVGRRFWPADNTDINRMFPGYDLGETTQRIADKVFQALQGYRFGIHLVSFYLSGDFVPHARMMDTGFQNGASGKDFGLPYLVTRRPRPYDTTTLNYNWQVWETEAYSLYTKETDVIDEASAGLAVEAVLRFLSVQGLVRPEYLPAGAATRRVAEESMSDVLTCHGGLFRRYVHPGDRVDRGTLLAEVLDPCTLRLSERIVSPCTGQIFFSRKSQLICGHEVVFRIIEQR